MLVVRLPRLALSLLATATLFLRPKHAAASCECGYLVNITTTNSTSTTTPTLFTSNLETDFLHLSSLNETQDWLPQNYTIPSAQARGPYGKNASLDNISPNPLQSPYDWSGTGTTTPTDAGGLQLYVRSAANAGTLIGTSEIATKRNDIQYGSFRAGIKTTGQNGTCSAFFFYRNDTQEIDLEFLSAHPDTLNLVLQSRASLLAGFNAASTPGFRPYPLSFDPSEDFHEYRYDWTSDAVSFYVDGAWLQTMTLADGDVPSSPGEIHLSHWSNGDPLWSGGPPLADAVMTVSYFKAYFNTSIDSGAVAGAPPDAVGCAASDRVCTVPDSRAVLLGNASVRQVWFADGGDGKVWNGTGKAPGVKGGVVGRSGNLEEGWRVGFAAAVILGVGVGIFL